MSRLSLEVAARTDLGRVRKFNEDSVATDPDAGVMVIADGLAVQKGAEVASGLATSTLLDRLKASQGTVPRAAVHAAFTSANKAIRDRAAADAGLAGMATTVVLAWFRGDRVSVAHVGDSRLYRFRSGRLERLTTDHSFLQSQLASGGLTAEEAKQSRSRHFVTRVLGAEEQVMPDLAEHEVMPGDVYVLCTDGLHDVVEDDDVANVLDVLDGNLELAATTLVAMANDRGGRDNISVILVRARKVERAERARKLEAQPEPAGLFGWLRAKMGG